jgi:hypothetical protein
LLTGGSGFDSTTTAGGLAALAGTFAAGAAGAFAGGAATFELGWSKVLSTP